MHSDPMLYKNIMPTNGIVIGSLSRENINMWVQVPPCLDGF